MRDQGIDRQPVGFECPGSPLAEQGQPHIGEIGEDVLDIIEVFGAVWASGRDDGDDLRRLESVPQLVSAMLNRERDGDRSHAGAGQDAQHQLGDVRQLDRYRVTPADAQIGQCRRQPVDDAVDVAPGQPEGFTVEEGRTVRGIDERRFVGPACSRPPHQLVQRGRGLVIGVAQRGHRTHSTLASLAAGVGPACAEQPRRVST